MATKRVTHTFRKGDILEVKEYHDGRYGARGLSREKKRKPTPEQMAVVNAMNKAETARHRLLEQGRLFPDIDVQSRGKTSGHGESEEGFHESDQQAKNKIQERTDRIALDPEH